MNRVNPSPALRRQIFLRDSMVCQYCATRHATTYVLDHVIPVAWGGPTMVCNLVVACEACNIAKRDKVIWVPLNLDILTADNLAWRALILNRATPRGLHDPDLDVNWHDADPNEDCVYQFRKIALALQREPWQVMGWVIGDFVERWNDIQAEIRGDLVKWYDAPDTVEQPTINEVDALARSLMVTGDEPTEAAPPAPEEAA